MVEQPAAATNSDPPSRIEARHAERLNSLFERTKDAIVLMDLERRVTLANPAAAQLLGVSTRSLRGRPLRDILQADGADRLEHELEARGQVIELGARLREAREGRGHVAVTVLPLRSALGVELGFAGILNDESALELARRERRDLEEQLLQSRKLESIGQLAGGVAHDFNNLLMAILGYADLLESRLAADPAGREELHQIRRAGERAADLTRQLLTFGRRQFLDARPVQLNAVVDSIQGMLRRLLPESIRIETQLEERLSPILADPGQIEQMLLNICVNARDAMPKGGVLRITTRGVRYGAHPALPSDAGDHVLLEISDSGVGMTPQIRERIFEPFFTTKEVGKGTGLGLATVYGIVTQLHGRVQVASELGRGSTFSIFLPSATKAEQPAAAISRDGIELGTETLLVAEDDEFVLDIATQILEGNGYSVIAARNGQDAVDAFTKRRDEISLSILDAVMPGLSGREVYLAIKNIDPEARVMFCSGYGGDVLPVEFLASEHLPLVRKPYDSFTLLRKVREVLDA